MKKNLLFLIVSIFLISCQTDDFEETERYFLTDKDTYQIGDEFILTTVIEAEKEKEVRFYRNFKNLEISFALMNETRNIHNGNWSKSTGEFLEETDIVEYEISEEKPFKKEFIVKIKGDDKRIVITIPELNFETSFDRSEIDENTKVRVHGFCNPINPAFGASLEDYFEPKDITIEKHNALQPNL